jgi:hypothetical protein
VPGCDGQGSSGSDYCFSLTPEPTPNPTPQVSRG